MKLKLPLALLAALFMSMSSAIAAETVTYQHTQIHTGEIPVYTNPVVVDNDADDYFVKIQGNYSTSWYLNAADITWDSSYSFTKGALNVGSALTASTLSIVAADAETPTEFSTAANLFIGCPGWGISATSTYKPQTGKVYVGENATLIVGKGSGSDTSTSQLNVGAGTSYSTYGHEGILEIDGGTVKAGSFNVANGLQDCKGTTIVKNGGTAIAEYRGGNTGVLVLGYYTESSGTMIVEGASTVTAQYYTMVGYGRPDDSTGEITGETYGVLEVRGKSTANLGSSLQIGRESHSHGTVLVDDSSLTAGTTYLGMSANSSGSLTLQNGATGTFGKTYVGYYDTGTMTIASGSTATMSSLKVGYYALTQTHSTLTVDGEGSHLGVTGDVVTGEYSRNNSTINVSNGATAEIGGYLQLAGWSDSVLNITGGSQVTVNSYILAGAAATTSYNEDILVDGSGSKLTAKDGLFIGYQGRGSLSVTNGGSVSVDAVNYAMFVGNLSGSQGELLVSGEGSSVTVGCNLYVGNEGTGTMKVEDGGEVFVTGGVGSFTEGSSIELNNGSLIAFDGVAVTNGAQLRMQGSSTLNVAQAGASISGGSEIFLGSEATVTGSLTLSNGATLHLQGVDTRATVGSLGIVGFTETTNSEDGSTVTSELADSIVLVDGLGGLSSGSYTLLNYTGTATGDTGKLVLDLTEANSKMVYTLDTATEGALKLNVSVAANDANVLVWKGESATWDQDDAGALWDAPAADDGEAYFADKKSVIFEGGTANVSGEVAPDSILVIGSNDTTIASADSSVDNKIAGETTGLTKDGTGTLTISVSNESAGANTILDGKVVVTTVDGLGKGDYEIKGGELVAETAVYDQKLTMTGGSLTVEGFGENAEIGDVSNGSITTLGEDETSGMVTVGTATESTLTSTHSSIVTGELTSGNTLEASRNIITETISDSANKLTALGYIDTTSQAIAGDSNTLNAGEDITTGLISGDANSLSAGTMIAAADISGDGNTLTAESSIAADVISGDANMLTATSSIETSDISGAGNNLSAGTSIVSGAVSGTGNELSAAKYLVLGDVSGEGNTFVVNLSDAEVATVQNTRLALARAATPEEGSITVGNVMGEGHEFSATGTVTIASIAGASHTISGADIVVTGAANGTGHSFTAANSISITSGSMTNATISAEDVTFAASELLGGAANITASNLDIEGSTLVLNSVNSTCINGVLTVNMLSVSELVNGSFTLDIANIADQVIGDSSIYAFDIVFAGSTAFDAQDTLTVYTGSQNITAEYKGGNTFAVAVPEPTTATLSLLALAALAARRRRK